MITDLDEATMAQMVRTHQCGDDGCKGRLSVAWGGFWNLDQYILRCGLNAEHSTIAKIRRVRELYDPKTGEWIEMGMDAVKETSLAIPTDRPGMLARVAEADAIGLFPDKASPDQKQVLAAVCLAYGLDPLLGELIPYQGRPYITINGRRRLDAQAGHNPSIKFRPLTQEEKEYYREADAFTDGDLAEFCLLTTEHGNTVEGFGRVLASEKKKTGGKGDDFLPLKNRPIEMVHKRSEYRARLMAYGPAAAIMGTAPGIHVIEGEVVEGSVVSEHRETAEPDHHEPPKSVSGGGLLEACPEHAKPWIEGTHGRWHGMPKGEALCSYQKVVRGLCETALRFMEHDEPVNVTNWLHDQEREAWSSLTPEGQLDVYHELRALAVAFKERPSTTPTAPPAEAVPPSGAQETPALDGDQGPEMDTLVNSVLMEMDWAAFEEKVLAMTWEKWREEGLTVYDARDRWEAWQTREATV